MGYNTAFIFLDRQTANINFTTLQKRFPDKDQLPQLVKHIEKAMVPDAINRLSAHRFAQAHSSYQECLQTIIIPQTLFKTEAKIKKDRAIKQSSHFFRDVLLRSAFYNLNNAHYGIRDQLLNDFQLELLAKEEKAVFGVFGINKFYNAGIKVTLSPPQMEEFMAQTMLPVQEVFVQTIRNVAAKKMLSSDLQLREGFKLFEPQEYDDGLETLVKLPSVAALRYQFNKV